MSEHPFSYLINLVKCDQKIDSLKENIKKLEHNIVTLQSEKEQYTHDLAIAERAMGTAKKNVDLQELEMKTLDQQEQHKKAILANITDYKQYQSLKAEIDTIQKKQLEQEAAVLAAWNQLESAQIIAEKKKHDVAEHADRIETIVEEKKNQREVLQVELDALCANRPEQEQAVPAEWLEKYDTIHARVSDPIVPIIDDGCSACSQIIIPSDCARIRRGALMQCKSCFRLLYSPEVMDMVK